MSHPAPPTSAGGVDPLDPNEPARAFQHYEVLRHPDGSLWELGRGTMGITYKAFDVNLCCEVALKVVNAALLDHPNARERFVREARAAAALRHRNVASVYHLGNDGERFFYAMEFIDGETLDTLVRRQGPLPVETALQVTLQTARALAAADRQKLVHRDIKPANIMVVHEDADEHMVVKVIDFGLARPVAGEESSQGALTVAGFVGTPQFASPEQLEEHALDTRSDIYSLGVTAWFLLTGRPPFSGSLATICSQHLTSPPPWEQLPEWLPGPVRRLLGHMLEKDPARRPQNAVGLRREIEECLETVRTQPPVGDGAGTPKPAAALAPPRAPGAGQPRTGTILLGRYELVRRVGEGPRGLIFEGRDTRHDGQAVAVTFPSPEWLAAPGERDRLASEIRLVQAAPHPHLTQVFAFQPPAGGAAGFLVEEWVNGGTLVDLLAARGGTVSATEGLRLLGQTAAAADYAATRRLERLDLAIHQVRLHFQRNAAATGGDPDPHEHLCAAMSDWPAWALKINPLGTIGDQPELDTWAGEVTLVPGIRPTPGRHAGANLTDTLFTTYRHALAVLVYELLGGVPGSLPMATGARGKYVSLPALNEEANTVLRQSLEGTASFRRSREFYETLARAAGFDPVGLQLAAPRRPSAAVPVVPGTRRPASPESADTMVPAWAGAPAKPPPYDPGTDTPFHRREETRFGLPSEAEIFSEGSISDRLTLVSGDPSPVGRWLVSLLLLMAVFVLAVAGVWVALAQRLPPRNVTPPAAAKANHDDAPNRPPRHRPSGTPRLSTPPPLPAETAEPPSPSPNLVEDRPPVPGTPAPAPVSAQIAPGDPGATPTRSPMPLVRLRIRSIPSGAEIRSAGRTLGITPLEIELPPGAHELSARREGWPETRETVVLGEAQPDASAEIHLMPPGLVPGADAPPSAAASNRPRHPPNPLLRVPGRRVAPVAPAAVDPSTSEPMTPPPPTEPEVRRALPPLTPFDPDEASATSDTTKNPPASARDGN